MRLAVILAAVAGVAIHGMGLQGTEGRGTDADGNPAVGARADLIEIDSMKVLGELERPSVVFLHDTHADALDREGKDCSECHPSEDGRLSPRFKRPLDSEGIGKGELMDLYHTNCLACHRERDASGSEAGPVEECGHCHRAEPDVRSGRMPYGLDKSLHHRHVMSLDSKCESCHHQYDEEKKALVYVKDTAGSCRYCHGPEEVENRIPMQQASHFACIDCHRKKRDEKTVAGPTDCAGCHDPARQELVRKVDPVPRMDRKHRDLFYIRKGSKNPYLSLDAYLDPKMAHVPFDHKRHEEANESCRSCHHADLASCNTCHTLAGAEKGAGITLEQAMHQPDSDKSCTGCHGKRVRQAECAGCHILLSDRRPVNTGTCVKCHRGPFPDELAETASTTDEVPATLVSVPQTTPPPEVDDADFPETVFIKALTAKYEMVAMPHRRIVDAIWQRIGGNRLAGHFHGQAGTLCRGCHHNSPSSERPPRCGSCHGRSLDDRDPYKPGLMAAYHGQCMGCHSQMKVAKPLSVDCTSCHAERKG